MSSLRDRLKSIESRGADSKPAVSEEVAVEDSKKQKIQDSPLNATFIQDTDVKSKVKLDKKIVAKVSEISEDLDSDKLQTINNKINEYIFKLIMYPINLIDRLIIVLCGSGSRRKKFNKVEYLTSGAVLLLSICAAFFMKDWLILIGAVLGLLIFEVIIRSIRK